MQPAANDIESWKPMVEDRSTWQHLVKEGIKHAERTRNMQQVEKRNIRKAMGTVTLPKQFSNLKDVIKTVIQKLGL